MKSLQGIVYLTLIGACFADKLSAYGELPPQSLDQYSSGGLLGASSSFFPIATSPVIVDPIAALTDALPGIPGADYPILAQVPETSFSCDGQVEGGYYADPDAGCQAFHVCAADKEGGLVKYSFLCGNGTIFNQGAFICDWWFNFDCSQATALYSKNNEMAAVGGGFIGSGSAFNSYEVPAPSGYGSPVPAPAPSAYGSLAPAPRPVPAPSSYGSPAPPPRIAPISSAYSFPAPIQAPVSSSYGSSVPVPAPSAYGSPASSSYGSPAPPPRIAPISSAYGSPAPIQAPVSSSYGSPVPTPISFPVPSSVSTAYELPAPIPVPIPDPSQPFYIF